MDKIGVVIPTFNRKESLDIILGQLINQSYSNILIIVVVDGSTDGTIELLDEKYSFVHTVSGDGTWFYTRSMNEGFKYAEKLDLDFILTMNDDTEIDSDFVQKLYNSYKNTPNGSIVGSMSITNEEKPRIFFPGIYRISKNGMENHYYIARFKVFYNKAFSGVYKSILLPGRGILIPINTLRALHGFDNKLLQYASDDDFCLRARKNGFKTFISWDAVIVSDYLKTAKTSTFLKSGIKTTLNGFFNKYSAISLRKFLIFHSKHYSIVNLPFKLVYYILRNIFKKRNL